MHTVAAGEAGSRCDVAVARVSGASRGAVALAIRAGTVTLNGHVPKPAMPVAEGCPRISRSTSSSKTTRSWS
jgi:hypothetical protein